jgi:hypothetical protein
VRNRIVRVTLPDPNGAGPLFSPVLAFRYDADGNLVQSTDPDGNVTRFSRTTG